MNDELGLVADALKRGSEARAVTVREFLGWFNARRRGYNIVQLIRQRLTEEELTTDPDFEGAWIDGTIHIRLAKAIPPLPPNDRNAATTDQDVQPGLSSVDDTGARTDIAIAQPVGWISRDPSYRLSKLAAANAGIVSIQWEATLSQATTLMLARDFSQLPVMNSRRVHGVVSWTSIGAALASRRTSSLARCYVARQQSQISATASIFDAIPLIDAHGYVLVYDTAQIVTGIVTSTDLSQQLTMSTEPFLLLGEIENSLRNMVGAKFTPEELVARVTRAVPGGNNRPISSVSDLTLGEYIRLLQNKDNWDQLELNLDQRIFCEHLDKVRQVRNDVTHFDPDGIDPDELRILRLFAHFIRQLNVSTVTVLGMPDGTAWRDISFTREQQE